MFRAKVGALLKKKEDTSGASEQSCRFTLTPMTGISAFYRLFSCKKQQENNL
jgi:hypothetical protein